MNHDDRFLYYSTTGGNISKISIKDPIAGNNTTISITNVSKNRHIFSLSLAGKYLFFTTHVGWFASQNSGLDLDSNEIVSNWYGLDWNNTVIAAEEQVGSVTKTFVYWAQHGAWYEGFFKRDMDHNSVTSDGGLTLYGNQPDESCGSDQPIRMFCMDDSYVYIVHAIWSSKNTVTRVNRNDFSSDIIFDGSDFPNKIFNLTVDDTYVYFTAHGSGSDNKGKVCRIEKSVLGQTPDSSSFEVLVDATDSNQPVGILEDGEWIYYLDNEVYKISKNGGTPIRKTVGLNQTYENSSFGNPALVVLHK
ncbi:MAG: hypothetical protein GY749_16170 [Desulfobacteraceae bacterium]|nr:hypothetical protein [Desulfobacteraceae bacterium]